MGYTMVCEQVSHHPPVSAFYAESPEYILHGSIHPKLKFWGKSVEVTPKGLATLYLKKYADIFIYFELKIQNLNWKYLKIESGFKTGLITKVILFLKM